MPPRVKYYSKRNFNPGDCVVYAIAAACLSMNFVLAIINNIVASVPSSAVIGTQALLTLAAIFAAVYRGIRVRSEFVIFIAICGLFLMASSIYRHQIGPAILLGDFDPKVVYDLLLIPIFIALGSTIRRFSTWFLHAIFALTFVVSVAEIALPDSFAATVNPLSYYVNTRGWVAQQVSDGDAAEGGFYIGTNRPGGSAVGGSETGHRAGSIFRNPSRSGISPAF